MVAKIGQLLIRAGEITEEQLQEALRTQQFFGGYLGSHLINLGHLNEDTLGTVLAEIHGVPYAPFTELRAAKMKTASAFPAQLAVQYKSVPFRKDGNRLHVAMANPRDSAGLNAITAASGMNVIPYVSPEFRIVQTIERLYKVSPKTKRGIVMKPASPTAVPAATTRAGMPAAPAADGDPPAGRVAPHAVSFGAPDLSADPGQLSGEMSDEELPRDVPRSLREWREEDPLDGEDLSLDRASTSARRLDSVSAPPESIGDVSERLRESETREQICRVVAEFMARSFRRTVVLALLPDRVRVLEAAGEIRAPEALRQLSLPSDPPTLFEALRRGKTYHLGPTAPLPGSRVFFWALGGDPPHSVFIFPVSVRDRTVALLYADNGSDDIGPVDMELWKRLSRMAGLAFEIQLLRNKLSTA